VDPLIQRFYREIHRHALSQRGRVTGDLNSPLTGKILSKQFLSSRLAAHVRRCQTRLKTHYLWGGIMDRFTEEALEALFARYPLWYEGKQERFRALIGSGAYGCDCSGLIKSYLFGGPDHPGYEAFYDLSSGMLFSASDKKGGINTLPELEGLCLYMPGHVGVYLGGGQVMECTNNPGFGDGVVQTRIGDRPWTDWFCCPFIGHEGLDE